MQGCDGDLEMTPSEVRTKNPDLREIVEWEGIDLPNILEQWKNKGIETIPPDQLDQEKYLFQMREEGKTIGTKCMHGEIGNLGVKSGHTQHPLSSK